MARPLKDIIERSLKGDKSSTVVDGSTGHDPGVDYDPKAKGGQDFVKLHKTEKHADRVGNGDGVYTANKIKYSLKTPQNSRMGNTEKKAKAANEETEISEVSRAKLTSYINGRNKQSSENPGDISPKALVKSKSVDMAFNKMAGDGTAKVNASKNKPTNEELRDHFHTIANMVMEAVIVEDDLEPAFNSLIEYIEEVKKKSKPVKSPDYDDGNYEKISSGQTGDVDRGTNV